MAFTLKKDRPATYLVQKNGDGVGSITKSPSGWYCYGHTGDPLKIGPFITRDNALNGFTKWYEVNKPGQD